ncbi:hypothetical protein NCAS_0A04180 [Naumovozyma castellii]|uniref:t-SNARE coiled-coil homology domain-containing protein n=1 Tax=Naumovozyma castellii TaxID=27288 RepID=G0V684_NAUCA|nr:hypothetical protein NCAS_0A04180 [Naumovozyma castellii CBS 4309]CCC66976.1 hypothetical protein NCAS_0A04180 [Naumovozyma castellii CBS 4309]
METNIKDRTSEFQQSILSYKKRNKKLQQQQQQPTQEDLASTPVKTSEFQKRASLIANEISHTAQLLSKLAILAKRKPMFNDNPVEIAELSFLIKRKIYSIEGSLVELSKFQRSSGGLNNAYNNNNTNNGVEHSKNVVNLLNTKMKNISGDFKSVLETRQQLEMNNRDRWAKISTDEHAQIQQTNGSSIPNNVNNKNSNNNSTIENADQQRPTKVPQTTDLATAAVVANNNMTSYNNSNPFMSSLMDDENENDTSINSDDRKVNALSLPQNSDQQLMLMEEGLLDSNVYLQERNRAVETIESTIQEVGNLFQQLASMVQEQGEVIQRIDANVEDVDLNITGAQRELLKYFDRVKSNRWLAAKIFFIIFAFFLFWVLVN